ncbi:hypothetical protein HYZ99_02090 [Candidatus Peregrinibacteria bacterium]|nr:hypothetical protein [Candidatus Peregrinibacteria bacterium]
MNEWESTSIEPCEFEIPEGYLDHRDVLQVYGKLASLYNIWRPQGITIGLRDMRRDHMTEIVAPLKLSTTLNGACIARLCLTGLRAKVIEENRDEIIRSIAQILELEAKSPSL